MNTIEPRDASSVVLVRDCDAGVEVFVQRRVAQMAFAAGMTVFPGGRVEQRDFDVDLAWSGPSPRYWAEVFGVEADRARAGVCAAVRETFEECGVLLAGAGPDRVVTGAELAGPSLLRARAALNEGGVSLAQVLREHGLVLRADLLRPMSNWITPVGERRRYDTRFFAAAAPAEQVADGATTEASTATWMSAADVLRAWRESQAILLPPTWSQLDLLNRHGSVSSLMAELAGRDRVAPVQPTIVKEGDGIRVEFDESEQYYAQGPGHPWAR